MVHYLMIALGSAVGIMGLVLFAKSGEFAMSFAGFLFFLFGVLFVMGLAGSLAEEAGRREE